MRGWLSRGKMSAWTAVVAVVLLASGLPARAQISPGPLAKAHASLEGAGGCLRCHAPQQGVASDRCLSCHTALQARIASGLGLHGRPGYRECEKCHIEHQGRESDLRWWGPGGLAAFRHADVGYPLEGKHRTLKCAGCHNAERVGDSAALTRGGVNPARTYLGLRRTCDSCHSDLHRGQFSGRECRECHTMETFKGAALFDHARTRYPLLGRHADVACSKCHPAADSGGKADRKYGGIASASCSDCHSDRHEGRLGADCASCHTTAGWSRVGRAGSFDHSRTTFPLQGGHQRVACEKCHRGRQTARVKHERCTDCHQDRHRGQFAGRADQGACEACHDVASFVPARFSLSDHDQSDYPLAGAHRAVPCHLCHKRASREETAAYRMAHATCIDCHKDPHAGAMNRFAGPTACLSCHSLESWRKASFNHAATRFPLELGHSGRSCGACHTAVEQRKPNQPLSYSGLSITCASCHRDPHAGQFVIAGATSCERCHGAAAWRPAAGFDHARDSSYRLDGAHLRVPCASCHRLETRDGVAVTRYKPLGTACIDCHSGKKL